MVLKGVEIRRDKIGEYLKHDITKYIEFFMNYKYFGFPYLGGWDEQPVHALDIIKLLEIEEQKWRTT